LNAPPTVVVAEDIDPLPREERSSDPDDDYLLALSEALARHRYLVAFVPEKV
jgi:hypothetical protein